MQQPSGPVSVTRSSGSRIAVIDKAVRVLDALLLVPDGMTPTDAAAAIQTNRSTAFRLLTSLEQSGLLERDAMSGRYRLGLKFLQYGESVRTGTGFVDLAEPIMRDLSAATGQSVVLAVREGYGARCIHRLPGPEVDVLSWKTGEWLPLHIGAAPQALLGALPDAEIERYLADSGERRTRHGAVSDEDLRNEVLATRRRGWALNREGLTAGVSSLGTAVMNSSGTTVCAISVAGLEYHYRGDELERTAAAVMVAAADIGRQLN